MYQNLIYISRYLDFYYQILNPYLQLPTPTPYLPLPTSTPIYPYPPHLYLPTHPYLPLNNFFKANEHRSLGPIFNLKNIKVHVYIFLIWHPFLNKIRKIIEKFHLNL